MAHTRVLRRLLGVLLRTVLLLAGCAALAAAVLAWVAREDAGRFDQAQLLARTAAGKTEARVTDLLARFERATGGLRPQDVTGDTTALSARLLRAEPLLAPATGLTVLNARGREVAGTSPSAGDNGAALQRAVAALAPEQRSAVFLPGPSGTDLLLARRIEGAGSVTAGIAVATVPADALRAIAAPPPALAAVADTRLLDSAGRELAGGRLSPADPAPSPLDPFRAWLPLPKVLPAVVTEEGAAGGLQWSAAVAPPPAADLSDVALPFGLCAVVLLSLAVLPGIGRSAAPAPDAIGSASVIEALQRKLAEAGSRSDRVLAAIGHDVRTPINSILGISGLLMDGTLDDGQRKWMARIRASCEALLAMLNGMLEIAAAGMDGAEVHKEPVDVATLVEEVREVLRPQAHDKGLDLQATIDPAVLGAWSTDPTRLRQVLFNLAGNGIKYTAAGTVGMEVDAGPEGLRFRVRDTGPGIPEEDREPIFEQFRRGRDAGTQGQEGLGLGLALCREIANLLGGTLTLESTVGVGSVFTFAIPAERLDARSPAGAPLAGRTALVVGLSEGVRRRAASHLERLGFGVETAADGFLALGLAERAAFQHGCLDLIVVDAALPGLPAEALLARLQSGTGGERVRTVVVSNLAVPPGLRIRVDASVPHPVEAVALERAVTDLFGATSVLQELDPRAPPPASLRILVVEDNRINQLLFVDVLERAGFSAFAASSGEEAVEAAARGGFDVILMDVQMPGIDGVEATRRIRAQEGARRTPIVGLTAHTGAGIRKRCLDAAMDSVLHKPVDLSRLPLRLREVASASRAATLTAQPDGADPARKNLSALDPAALDSAALDIADEYLEVLLGEAGVERARSCIEDFRSQISACLPDMSRLVDADLPALGHLAHNLAGVAGTLGVTGLLDGLLHVEDAARLGNKQAAVLSLHEVVTTWSRVQPVLRSRFEAIAARRGGEVKRVA